VASHALAAVPPFETTLGALLIERAASDPDHVIFIVDDDGQQVTVADLADRARAIAGALADRGIGPGDPVLTMMGNGLDHIALFLGLTLVGALWVPIDPRARGVTLAHAISVTNPVLAVAPAGAEKTLRDARLGGDCPILDVGQLLSAPIGQGGDFARAKPDDVRAIVFTSGTSGPPKGVMVSERMLIASAAGTALASDCRDGDIFLMWEPLHHIGGSQIVTMALVHRITLVLVDRFSASRLWAQMRHHGVTKLHYLGGILDILLKADPRADDRDHPVRLAFGGGCRLETWRAFEDRFGIAIREVYGMTEASSFTTINLTGVVGSVGTPVPWFDVDLVDEIGAPIADGTIGEIMVSATHPGLFTRGYLNAPEATDKLFKNGRLRSGDLGRRDVDGNLRFVGRVTDSLRRRGENVSAWEVETALAGHADIVESAVVGVPAAIGEHDILCFVILRDDRAWDAASLAAWCQDTMPSHHVPRYWKQVDTFSRTPSQRIRKDLLDLGLDTAIDMAADRDR